MKTKLKSTKLFIAIAAMAVFASCNKESHDYQESAPSTMNIKLSYGDGDGVSTYALDNPLSATDNTALDQAILFQMVGGNVFTATELDAAAIGQMVSNAGYRIENVNGSVNGILIAGNIPSGDISAVKALMTRAAIETYAIPVLSQQTSATNTGVTKVTVMGFGAVTAAVDPDAGSHTGHTYKEAAVTASPIVARMEVAGKVVSSPAPENQIQSIIWKEVYFNRYYTTATKDVMEEKVASNWATLPSWAHDAYNGAATENSVQCYAYQFYPASTVGAGLLPMIVMKADVTLKNGTTLTDYYITIKTFKKGSVALDKMDPNKIYKVNLSNLTIDHTDFTPTPNPEQVDLGIKVTITPWTVENLTPTV